jgi:hypothetical protein
MAIDPPAARFVKRFNGERCEERVTRFFRKGRTMWFTRFFKAAVSAILVLSFAPLVNAQRSVPGIEIQIDNWTFIPTLYNGEVETIVALRNDPPQGDNITAMWFLKGSNNSWSSYGWSEQNQAKTVGYVKTALQIPDADDRNWKVAPLPVNPEEVPARSMNKGLFVDDPFADAVASAADPDAVLDFLVTIGWSAARSSVISGCESANWLNAIAIGTQQDLLNPGYDFAEIDDAAISCQTPPGGTPPPPPPCKPRTIVGGVSSSGCPDLTGWIPTPPPGTGVTTGQCWPENCWHGSFFCYERRQVRKIYANCTTCTMMQTRWKNCTASVCELDTNTPLGTPPCTGVPAGYTPPSGPSIGPPSSVANPSCDNWGDWSPS